MSEQIIHVQPSGDHWVVFMGTASGEPTGKVHPGTKAQCEGLAGTFSRRDDPRDPLPILVASCR